MREDVVMFTRRRVAALADVRESRLDYWARTGLLAPSTTRRANGDRTVRLYDYSDLMSVLVIARLREQVGLQHVRAVIRYLRDLEFRVPEVTFAIVGNRVVFQLPSGEWEDGLNSGQVIFHQVLDLEPLKAAVRGAAQRSESDSGRAERRRGALGSTPVFVGTRVPVAAVRSFMDSGAEDAEILAAYPALTDQDLDLARERPASA